MKHRIEGYLANEPENGAQLKSILINTAKMLLILLVTIGFTELLRSVGVDGQSLIAVYCLSVLVISFGTPTYVYGILSAFLGTFAYDFLITEPRFGFSIFTGLPVTLVTMLLVTFLSSALTAQLKTQARLAAVREQRAGLLFEINQKLLAARCVDAIVSLTGDYLVSHLGLPAMLFTRDPRLAREGSVEAAVDRIGMDDAFATEEVEKRLHRIFTLGAVECEEPFDDTLQEILYEPVAVQDRMLGVIAVARGGTRLSPGNRTFVQMVAGQVALALEVQFTSDENDRVVLERERERMRSDLLRSISHDLRTPLTSILGASSTILEQPDLDAETRAGLAGDIQENAQWLIRMVENILVITRISRNMKVNKAPEAAEEVVQGAVSLIRKRYPECYIHVHIPDELVIVPMDATLISQVLINLLDNAVKNSPEGSLVILDLERKGGCAVFDVHDNGNGIPDAMLENLFEMPAAQPALKEQSGAMDSARGMGIGLSICKTIVHAHGGVIEGHNSKNGGATFSFRLPLEETGDA